MKCYNPFAFVPMAVTLIVAAVYLGILIPLLVIHETVPSAPQNPTLYRGLNISEAWLDLAELSNGYHPFNSRRNDEVRNWLLMRIEGILRSNEVSWEVDGKRGQIGLYNAEGEGNEALRKGSPSQSTDSSNEEVHAAMHDELRARSADPAATIFNDLVANYTSTALTSIGVSGRRAGISTYFEGNNIIVYVRGTEDEAGDWWNSKSHRSGITHGKGGVMVNAHFDSVSTGYGATDDGMGVITALQLIKYFTTSGNTPKKGVVALFNNGEEDGLYGAKAFLSHTMAQFVHTFLNLEGAGAGGRATLFRSTDTEVTRAYSKARNPFGSVVSSDGFALGFVRSETDYVVFRAEGFRGLDVAFWEPRSRYHTNQDDAKHASKDSLWHMLSASVETVKYLASDTSGTFTGPRGDDESGKVRNGKGTDGVWFDLFGQVFAVFGLRTLFAWSLTLLIATPLILILISYLLIQHDRMYLFAGSVKPEGHESEAISLQGWRGAFRFPIGLIISGALTVGAAFLIRKFNPLIIYSSQYSVWAMSFSLFFFAYWFIMAGCNFVRPSALHRTYALLWMFILAWAVLVASTVFEDRYKISGGYMFVFYEAAIFFASFIGLCELFALPTKTSVIESAHDEHETREGLDAVPNSDGLVDASATRADGGNDTPAADNADETTPLVGGNGHHTAIGASFARGYHRSFPDLTDGGNDDHHDTDHRFGEEQTWSAKLPTWTWVLQFVLLGPFILIVIGQVGLLLVTATAQTGTDGSPLLLPYLVVALFSILILLPTGPFVHRITHHIPSFLFLVFVGTLIYNLVAFPFSANNRYKAYFQQTVDLDSSLNRVTLVGLEEYIRDIISYIPSAAGQLIDCTANPAIRSGLQFCSFEGPAPQVVDSVPGVPPEIGYDSWLTYNVTRVPGKNMATFNIAGQETKACIIRFDDPFSGFNVEGAANSNGKWAEVPDSGSDQIKLWHRDWNRGWTVDVEWPVSEGKNEGDEGRSGRVVCFWSDHNVLGTIPALDEVQRFAPQWTSIVKLMDGLVEGSKAFNI
ncbi:Vacuolar membrane protease [Lachnellula suecica]|uniref:Peptide hydrolase n=1 Tax=Lachnellula suecica TaxID=602035 RepID=A0A8T9CCW5_9HELO|nr:Vacuolar membrane protease [Lachnellula suecica]